jgi:hypothetical protein
MANATQETLALLPPGGRFRYYALAAITGGDVDVETLGRNDEAPREIHVVGAGSLVVTPLDPITGDETIAVVDGMVLPIRVRTLKSTSSGFTGVLVIW